MLALVAVACPPLHPEPHAVRFRGRGGSTVDAGNDDLGVGLQGDCTALGGSAGEREGRGASMTYVSI